MVRPMRRWLRLWACSVGLLLGPGCSCGVTLVIEDAGDLPTDAGTADAGALDAGGADAGRGDAADAG